MPKSSCLTCGALIDSGSYCKKHGPKRNHAAKGGYQWQQFAKALIREHPYCSNPDCGHKGSKDNPLSVDMKIPGHPEAGYQVLCRNCNSRKRDSRRPFRKEPWPKSHPPT